MNKLSLSLALLLALTALVCLAVSRWGHAGSPGFPTASEQPKGEAAGEGDALGVAMVSDTLTASSAPVEKIVQETPAIEGSWATELEQFRKLAETDPETALARVAQVSTKEEQDAVLTQVCLQLASNDPALAMNAAWRFQLGKLGGLAERTTLENLASQWAKSDLPAALAWINEQAPDEDGLRDRVIKGIASAWSQNAPADAARLVAERMNPEHAQLDAAITVVDHWAAIDYWGAAAWVSIFPEGPVRDRGWAALSRVSLNPPPLE